MNHVSEQRSYAIMALVQQSMDHLHRQALDMLQMPPAKRQAEWEHREKIQRLSARALGMDVNDIEIWLHATRSAVWSEIEKAELQKQVFVRR